MTDSNNIKVLIHDHDLFALHAINSYLAWDRRTRVHFLSCDIEPIFEWLADEHDSEWPDFVILDTYNHTRDSLTHLIKRLRGIDSAFGIILNAHDFNPEHFQTALDLKIRAYFMRNDLSIYAASALVWVNDIEFGVSKSVKQYVDIEAIGVKDLPEKRNYPELTERIRQAIQLCVVEGMSADLAADEMGVSIHTIRSYIKEGYRILEAYDDESEYPIELSAQERAFIRFTSLDDEDDSIQSKEE